MKLTHSKLCELAVKWLRKVKKQNCKYHTYPITGSEIACYNGVKWIETPDAIGFNAYSSCVIECKMSRSDFFADQKKPFRTDGNGMGQKRFFLCPENLINENELPHGWGLGYTVNFIGGTQMDICEMDMADIRRVLELASTKQITINETSDLSEDLELSEMFEIYHNNKGATNER